MLMGETQRQVKVSYLCHRLYAIQHLDARKLLQYPVQELQAPTQHQHVPRVFVHGCIPRLQLHIDCANDIVNKRTPGVHL